MFSDKMWEHTCHHYHQKIFLEIVHWQKPDEEQRTFYTCKVIRKNVEFLK